MQNLVTNLFGKEKSVHDFGKTSSLPEAKETRNKMTQWLIIEIVILS